ncbi:hypothetical protein [Xanthomonas perforans]|uniref:hypothetical protein n=1 Tax=Xanthomonas perforans TaxID=442694 RepID=UPI0023589748|nr:hypothetical protein [Xanthomonas perforans]MDC9654332.1 hypothetical protein [Xanthomonas perforans]MEB2158987.1 hypothetical protein [Xanthomonas campestris pv. campestris]
MHPIAFIVILSMMLLGYSSRMATDSLLAAEDRRQDILAGSLQSLAGVAGNFARVNPAAAGVQSVAAIGVPDWLVIPPGAGVVVAGARGYVFMQMRSEQMAASVALHCVDGAQCAVSRGGALFRVSDQAPLGAAPAGVPTSNAFVVVY